ncbi:MAG TPA: UvrD-helicase domain-containing protein [Candidatus Faecimonas gallistercoris]|nr:UvrD-helicase domain-containing protein [Candidatus Faecimonas gallistercoris]
MQIGNYTLDKRQEEIIKEDNNYILVTAGAGSGKTLTILGKIKYLTKQKNIKPEQILCISFTKAATESLKEKIKINLNIEVPTYTFHKLSLEIIKEKALFYEIAEDSLLEEITNEFFEIDIYSSPYLLKLMCKYFKENTNQPAKSYQKILENNKNKLLQLQKLCITFIRLMKCNNYKLKDFLTFLSKTKKTLSYKQYKTEKTLLTLIINIYLKYETYLKENKEIDFDDMLIKATKIIKEQGLKKKIKYIIIDEYQDTSFIRFNLIKEIIKKTNAKLMVVGDDFQSIYRFTGCDVSLFINFKTYFKEAKIMKLERTYRNSKELIQVAGKFIMKNKHQIKKELYSEKRLKTPIKILKYKNIKKIFLEIIKELSKDKEEKILVLGRNNKDIYLLLDEDIKIKKDKLCIKNYDYLDITYMTVHKSKGLESDNVIVVNLEDKITGFPSQVKEEKLTRLVTKAKDTYPYSEERRLFYVALTRTKNKVFLLVPEKNPSIFIEELQKIIK